MLGTVPPRRDPPDAPAKPLFRLLSRKPRKRKSERQTNRELPVLTVGSVAAFGMGRWLGAHYVRTLVSQETWDKMGFIVEAEGAILCFIIYLTPGLPKDLVCYLFRISPMPLWIFALVSTLGRVPGTWVLSAQGAHTAAGDYLQVILLTAIAVAVAVPLYYYRNRIVAWFRGRSPR